MSDSFLSPQTRAGQLRIALLALWKEHKSQKNLPTSGRFLFYELLHRRIVSKNKEGKRRPDQDMTDALSSLRKREYIPWADIVDETRELTQWRVYSSIAEGMREAFWQARLNIWEQDTAPMILCESRSLKGVLEPLAYEYQVPIASTNGQCGGFLHTEVGPALKPGQIVLYLGDLDLAGGHIEANTRTVLEQIVGGALQWERIAITQEQADSEGLEPIQKYDARDKKKHPAIETEALGQSKIVALVRARLRQLMPERRRKAVQERESKERDELGIKLGYIAKPKKGIKR